MGLYGNQGRHHFWKGGEERGEEGQGQQTAESGQQSKRHRQQDHDRLRQRGQGRQWRTIVLMPRLHTQSNTQRSPDWKKKTYCRIFF